MDDYGDNINTPLVATVAALRVPLSGLVDYYYFVFPEGEGWAWPVAAAPGGDGGGAAVGGVEEAKGEEVPLPPVDGCGDNINTPSGAALWAPGPMGYFVLPESEGWAWPVAGAAGSDGGGAAVGGVEETKGGEVAVSKPIRCAWIGRPSTVGVEHQWGSWKTFRVPQKWEKAVSAALVR